MKLQHSYASVFIPDGLQFEAACSRVTHLGVGAHSDDLEFMAFHGILQCYQRADRWFGGVTCTNGFGSSRVGPYAGLSDEETGAVRREEQNNAAVVGQYGVMVQLGYSSGEIGNLEDGRAVQDLEAILRATRPEIVYTHNPADKHSTHIAVFAALLRALRNIPAGERPECVWGCEVWRDLDWMPDERKVLMDVSGRDHLAAALNGIFDSQIAGGKRYDLGVAGRRAANATFYEPRASDHADRIILGMDLSPLVKDDSLDPAEYVGKFIEEFAGDVRTKLKRFLP